MTDATARGGAAGDVLVVNVGSSTVKLAVVAADGTRRAATELDRPVDDATLDAAVAALPPAVAVGHRIVHGGPDLTEPVRLDPATFTALDATLPLAPLHNPPAIDLARRLCRLRPELPAVACFDTAFHATLPDAARTYALPAGWRQRFGLRRYGFHGLSHRWAAARAAELLAADPVGGTAAGGRRLVTAHLGAGCSLAAVVDGRSVDTTMGFTPLEGLVMATRSGTVDPGLVLWLAREGGLGVDEVEHGLEHESGLAGLSGRSGDVRQVVAGAAAGDAACRLALDVYVHRLRAGVAAMAAAMGGLDALVFTGGVGEHVPEVRAAVAEGLAFLGVAIDADANRWASGADAVLSPPAVPVAVLTVVAREDAVIAADVRALLALA